MIERNLAYLDYSEYLKAYAGYSDYDLEELKIQTIVEAIIDHYKENVYPNS